MNWIDWPKEPGFYWFYGFTDYKWAVKFNLEPELLVTMAHFGGEAVGDKRIMVHRWAEYLYQRSINGKFLKMDEPAQLPELIEELP